MSHDPALCPRPACSECDAYGDGYTRGKSKAFAEVTEAATSGHTPDCGCQPCRIAARVALNVFQERVDALDALDGSLQSLTDVADTRRGDPTRELAAFGPAVLKWFRFDPEAAACSRPKSWRTFTNWTPCRNERGAGAIWSVASRDRRKLKMKKMHMFLVAGALLLFSLVVYVFAPERTIPSRFLQPTVVRGNSSGPVFDAPYELRRVCADRIHDGIATSSLNRAAFPFVDTAKSLTRREGDQS